MDLLQRENSQLKIDVCVWGGVCVCVHPMVKDIAADGAPEKGNDPSYSSKIQKYA